MLVSGGYSVLHLQVGQFFVVLGDGEERLHAEQRPAQLDDVVLLELVFLVRREYLLFFPGDHPQPQLRGDRVLWLDEVAAVGKLFEV